MLRQVVTISAIMMTLAAVAPAEANDWDEFWARYRVDHSRNRAWPQPFLQRDQYELRAPFAAMTHTGWQEQNTLTEHHFDAEKNELNRAGMFKIQSVLRNSPPERRAIFVYAGFDQEINEKRLEGVRQQIAQWLPEDQTPSIVMTTRRPYGLPGGQADALNRNFQENLPTPAITVTTGGTAGSGGGGGN